MTAEFYEADEPTADVVAAFDAGEKILTGPCPTCGHVEPEPPCQLCHGSGSVTKTLSIPGGYGMTLTACPNGCQRPHLVNAGA